MSEVEGQNDQNNDIQKMNSVHEEEDIPNLQDLLAQMVGVSPKKPRTPTVQIQGKSASQSTDLRPLKSGNTGTGISGTIPSSAAVQVNRNKQKGSRVAQANKKIATGKNKGVVIKEVLEKKAKA